MLNWLKAVELTPEERRSVFVAALESALLLALEDDFLPLSLRDGTGVMSFVRG